MVELPFFKSLLRSSQCHCQISEIQMDSYTRNSYLKLLQQYHPAKYSGFSLVILHITSAVPIQSEPKSYQRLEDYQ
jgi:hypothetical protein